MKTTKTKGLLFAGILCLLSSTIYGQLTKKASYTFYLAGGKQLYGSVETHYDNYLLITAEPGSLINQESGMSGSWLINKHDLLQYSYSGNKPIDFADHQQSFNSLGRMKRYKPYQVLMRNGGEKQLFAVISALTAIAIPLLFDDPVATNVGYMLGGVSLTVNIWGFFELNQAGKLSVAKKYKAHR